MDQKKKSLVKVKKKMTKEQMQMAIIKKRECDAKALAIVEQLLEPQIDPAWLIENLKSINRCHMEDVIEERAITKLCGYVLCQKALTAVINQQYHISLRNKKVYDVTKRKNFCSSACFGASNYLLEQMLTSPLWLREKEEIPKFQIFTKDVLKSNRSHGEEVDIVLVEQCSKNEGKESDRKKVSAEKTTDSLHEEQTGQEGSAEDSNQGEVSGCIEHFVLETFKQININKENPENTSNVGSNPETENCEGTDKEPQLPRDTLDSENKSTLHEVEKSTSKVVLNKPDSCKLNTGVGCRENNTMRMSKDPQENIIETKRSDELSSEIHTVTVPESLKKLGKTEQKNLSPCIPEDCIASRKRVTFDVDDEKSTIPNSKTLGEYIVEENSVKELSSGTQSATSISELTNRISVNIVPDSETESLRLHSEIALNSKSQNCDEIDSENRQASNEEDRKSLNKLLTKKPKKIKNEKRKKASESLNENLAAKVEQSFQEWVSEETIHFLFGDDCIKKKAIEKIEHQDRYSILCEKLNRLQFQDEQEDSQILEKPALKPAPHFEVLKEEGQKLDVKVRAFFQGKTTFEPVGNAATDQKDADADTFLPLTDVHAPQALRRKIFLDRLDQVLPDLLRTLAGNNEVYARASCNYTSMRCTAVKALVHTFSLSAKNIIFKSAEWTLVGLVIIKMLSLMDPWLATLLMTKQANLYTSMILTSYKLNPDYLSLFVTSFNPNMNPR